MKTILNTLIVFLLFAPKCFGQISDSLIVPESKILDLNFLIEEALQNNPDIRAALYEWDMLRAKIPQSNTPASPELSVMQEDIPGFNPDEAMFTRVELMQMFHYPGKLSLMGELAHIQSEHAHHDHLEKINTILATLKKMYAELWYVQQLQTLNRENVRLMHQMLRSAQTKFGTGEISQQEINKIQIEISMLENELVELRQKELSAKSMLQSLLNRSHNDTLGFAVIAEEIIFTPLLDTLYALAFRNRPMLKHDSLGIHEGQTMLAMAKKQYYPDFNIGLEYLHSPMTGANGWSISAGITLPFAPWSIGKTDAQVQEASIAIDKSKAMLNATQNMVRASVDDLYYKIRSYKQQMENFASMILPQARASLESNLVAYQNGRTTYLMLIDSYRLLVDLTKEYYMLRMNFEQTLAELDKETGVQNVARFEN